MIANLVDRAAGYLADRLAPTARFQDPAPASPPQAAPAVAGTPEEVTAPTSRGPATPTPTSDSRRPGAGQHADNCRYLHDTDHRCTNSYGDPCRPGQDCYPSAAAESRRSFIAAHPSWGDRL